jgi:hypothetical protein
MTETTKPETCYICHGPGPLMQDPVGGAMLCGSCRLLVSMGPEWIDNAIRYLKRSAEKSHG